MSVARAYTDFHIDFGGSSVFYHILKGKKTFLFIEPSAGNLRRYEAWCGDSEQGNRFLGEEVRECIRIDLEAGDTMIIPSGWIHAVYTPVDSLVIGGNFLTPLQIISQLNIAGIETRTRVPKKFRFPFFDLAMWYTAIYYLEHYPERKKPGPKPRARKNTESMSPYELDGLKSLAEWLWKKAKLRLQQLSKGSEYHRAKVEVPPGIDVHDLASRFARWVYEADYFEIMGIDAGAEEGLPTWYRVELLGLRKEKGEVGRKRKRNVDEGDGDGTPVARPVRKVSRRVAPAARKDDSVQVVVPVPSNTQAIKTVRTDVMFSLSRPITAMSVVSWGMSRPMVTHATWTTPSYPLITYPSPKLIVPPAPLKLIKPYSTKTPKPNPQSETFVIAIKSLYRPYVLNPEPTRASHPTIGTEVMFLDEIQVEDVPETGLDVLTRAIEISTTDEPPQPTTPQPVPATVEELNLITSPSPPPYSSRASSLTFFSPDDPRIRLPTPPSPSPSPVIRPEDPVMREVALGLRRRSTSTNNPTESLPQRKKPGPKSGWKTLLAAQQEQTQSPVSPTATTQSTPRPRSQRSRADARRHSDGPPFLSGRRSETAGAGAKEVVRRVTRSSLSPISSRKISSSPSVPKGPLASKGDEAEARRLHALMTLEEITALRKKRRRASDFMFSATTLKRELDRLGKAY